MEKEVMAVENKLGALWIGFPDSITLDNSCTIEQIIKDNFHDRMGNVVLDFSRINNLYSSGLGLMIRIRKYVIERGGVLCIVNITERLHEMLIALNLDKVFPIYKTDVEYEISQDELWKKKYDEHNEFLFVCQLEDGIYRINLSGEMVAGQNLSVCSEFSPLENINLFILDLSSLELVDSDGIAAFKILFSKICRGNTQCRVFGASELIMDTLIVLLDASKIVTFFEDEKSVLEEINQMR